MGRNSGAVLGGKRCRSAGKKVECETSFHLLSSISCAIPSLSVTICTGTAIAQNTDRYLVGLDDRRHSSFYIFTTLLDIPIDAPSNSTTTRTTLTF